jgi:hypothetical protein
MSCENCICDSPGKGCDFLRSESLLRGERRRERSVSELQAARLTRRNRELIVTRSSVTELINSELINSELRYGAFSLGAQ